MGKISRLRLHKKSPDGVSKQELDVLQGSQPPPKATSNNDTNPPDKTASPSLKDS